MEGIEEASFPGEKRRHTRYELSLLLAYQRGPEKDTLRTVDVSLGGIKIQTDRPFPVDERLDLTILLENEAIRPMGKVVWSDPSSNRKYDIGICFVTISHQCLKRLQRFLQGTTLKGERAKWEKALNESDPKGLESRSFASDRLKANFLRWLHKSYPGDSQRYSNRPEISENEVRDFLKSKGIDQVNIHYLIKFLRDR